MNFNPGAKDAPWNYYLTEFYEDIFDIVNIHIQEN